MTEDILSLSQFLYEAPDIFPYVVLTLVILGIIGNRKLIQDYVRAAIKAKHETADYHARINELVRNNTAALNNNTAALEMNNRDRREMISYIENHEAMSKERMDNIRDDISQTKEIALSNQKELAIVKSEVRGN